MDWSGSALLKVAIEKFCGGSPTVSQFCQFFEKFVHTNGVRAQKQAVPMTYQEILILWSTHFSPTSTLDTASIGTVVQNELKKIHLFPNNKRGGGKTELPAAKNSRQDRNDNKPFCSDWNKTPSCSNTQVQGECLDQAGTFLKHSCIKRMPGGKFCGSSKHGLPG